MSNVPSPGRCAATSGLALAVTALFITLSACATVPGNGSLSEPILYPAGSEDPRIEFLGSFSTSADVLGETSAFKKFIVGEPDVKPLVKPYGFAIWNGAAYICDTVLGCLVVMDFVSNEFNYIKPIGEGRFSKPVNIAIDERGVKYVADTGRGRVTVLDDADRHIGALSREGGFKPVDVAVWGDKIYIADLHHRSVGVWDASSQEYLHSIPTDTDTSPAGKLYSPTNIALDSSGNLYVSDTGAAHVVMYDPGGTHRKTYGSLGTGFGQFVRPKGIDVDSEGRLFVADAATEVVQLFDANGDLLMFFGEPQGDVWPLTLPAKVRFDTTLVDLFASRGSGRVAIESLIFVSSQYGDNKISVFGFGGG